MNSTVLPNRRIAWIIFSASFALAMVWAASTSHVWEDYFITYRSSKNFSTGHGLVFNEGDRLHTFTSPLGVLLPAAANLLIGSRSDTLALWIFRVWSGMAFAGAAVLLYFVTHKLRYGAYTSLGIVALIVLDGKSLDFSTNGMETAFLLLFIAYSVWALFVGRTRRTLHLGVAWAGLMWTRPDGFLYIGLLALGTFLFNDQARTELSRPQLLGLFLRAGLLCAVLYLPWFVWAWWYYGTPVPHTITAKGGVSGSSKSALGLLKTLLNFPWTVWTRTTSLDSTFMPSYFQLGGWPMPLIRVAQVASLLLAFQWVIPWRFEVRVASFAFCGMHAYLSYFPYFPFPWYLPGVTLLAVIALGGIADQLIGEGRRRMDSLLRGALRNGAIVVLVLGLGTECWATYQMNREMKLEQIYSGNGVRRKVGEWLGASAQKGDTVFMEPLGNIGYYSGLKTYDFPGLSSREVVEAIRLIGVDWAGLIEYLSPDWIVLRPQERDGVNNSIHRIFDENNAYKLVKEFNNLPEIEKLEVYGRKYIEFDARFLVYRRQVPRRYKLNSEEEFPFEKLRLPVLNIDGHRMYTIHATGMVSLRVPQNARHVRVGYGLPEATYNGAVTTDGVEFDVIWTDGRESKKLLSRFVSPMLRKEDRGAQFLEADIPSSSKEATILLMTRCGPNDAMDWSSWSMPEFK